MITPHTTPPLFALLGSTWSRRQILFALHSGNALRIIGPVVFASGWQELRDLTRRHPGSPAFVDPYFGGRRDPFAGERDYSSDDWAPVPLICYARMDARQRQRLEQTAIPFTVRLRPGANQLYSSIDAAILRSIDAQGRARLLGRIRRTARRETHVLFASALESAIEPCSVVDFARRLRLTVRTLQRRCSNLGIPSPKHLLSLARVFTVERLADWSRQPSGAVAMSLGFSDRSNYRRLVRQVLGGVPGQIRVQGGMEHIEDVVVEGLARAGGAAGAESTGWPRGWTKAGRPAAVPS